MYNICQYNDCNIEATFGVEKGKRIFCKKHKNSNMISVIHEVCKCGVRPSYNLQGEKKGICCKKCKTDSMVNIISNKCNCGFIPTFNEPGETRPICCVKCKTSTMINVNKKKCNCGITPSYNIPGEITALYCKKCKTENMIDVKHKKCNCGFIPLFNEPGEKKGICCSKCKTNTMIDIKSNKCKCGTHASFNLPNKKIAEFCFNCKSNDMIDIKNKKCIGFNNNCPYLNRGNSKYKYYCIQCFQRQFPLDPLTFQINYKTKEICVRNFINENFIGFQHDSKLETNHCDCTIRRRIDHRKLINNTLLVVETDENQHKSYNKMDEETRYDDLFMAYSGKWIYIRFNPDKYKDKNGKNKNPELSKRLIILKNELEKQIKRIENEENTELIERIYLFYDEQ
jgi:hypothetical protein